MGDKNERVQYDCEDVHGAGDGATVPALAAALTQQTRVLQQGCKHKPGHGVQQSLVTERHIVPICNRKRFSQQAGLRGETRENVGRSRPLLMA